MPIWAFFLQSAICRVQSLIVTVILPINPIRNCGVGRYNFKCVKTTFNQMERQMKKIYTLAFASVLVSGAAVAGPGHNSANMNNNMPVATITTVVEPVVDRIVTVEQIPMMRDNQNVVMTGYIVEDLGDEMYVFQDATGTIHVEIEPVILGEMVIVPDTKMKLRGQIDKGDNGEPDVIEVDYITTM